jgi:hypothetical protein
MSLTKGVPRTSAARSAAMPIKRVFFKGVKLGDVGSNVLSPLLTSWHRSPAS